MDSTGTMFAEVIIRGLISGIISAIVAIASGSSPEAVLESFVKGSLVGAISALSLELSVCLLIINLGVTYIQLLMDGLTSNESLAAVAISAFGQIALPETGDSFTDEQISYTFGMISDVNSTYIQEALKEENTSNLSQDRREYVFYTLVSISCGGGGGSFTTSCLDSLGGTLLWEKP